MKTIIALTVLFFSTTLVFGQESVNRKGWKLVWSDEFNYNGLPNPAKWGYEEGFIRNDEPQYYTVRRLKNARVVDGHLIIEARREEYSAHGEKSHYTSASINTLHKNHFKFGKIEMRAKFDAKQGMWPAFWMMGITRGTIPWPEFGEVDIMEYYRNAFHANAVYRGEHKNIWNAKSTPIGTFTNPSWAENYHVYSAIWDKNEIKIYVDNYLLNAIDISQIVDAKSGENPFHSNHETRGKFARQVMDYFSEKDAKGYFAYEWGPVFKLVLDTGEDKSDDHPVYGGIVDFDNYRLEQAKWAEEIMKTRAFKKAKFRVVMMHIPHFHSGDGHGTLHCRELFAPLFEKYKVDMVISGHTRRYGIWPSSAEHSYPIIIGGGPTEGKRTLIKVKANKENLQVNMLGDDGSEVGNIGLAVR